jgi:hypothetical protein
VSGPTHRAVDRWVRTAFFEPFRGFEPFRFGGDSRLTHLPLTLTVSWHLNPLETEVSLGNNKFLVSP